MNLLHRIELWGDRHHPKWLDIVRIALGIFLCIRGIQFPTKMSHLLSRVQDDLSFDSFTLVLIGHYVLFAHLMGGILLAAGVFTRLACIVQIPILLGAILFVNPSSDLWHPFSEMYVSLIVLALLILFLVIGNGSWSADKYLVEKEDRRYR